MGYNPISTKLKKINKNCPSINKENKNCCVLTRLKILIGKRCNPIKIPWMYTNEEISYANPKKKDSAN
jgi:hypothetical protein